MLKVEWKNNILLTLLLAATYLLVSWVNYYLFKSGGVLPMPIWPAAGLAIAVCFSYGIRSIPGIWLGTLLANHLIIGSTWQVAALIGISNSFAPLLAVFVIRGVFKTQNPFEDLRSYLAFLFIAVILHPAITASGGISAQLLLKLLQPDKAYSAWLGWWFAHSTGTILFGPIFYSLMAEQNETPIRKKHEYLMVFALTFVATLLFFSADNPFPAGTPYLLVIPMAYVAVRYSMLRSMMLFALVIVTGMTGIVINPAIKLDSNSVLMPFRMMAISFSVVLVMLSILRKIYLAAEKDRTFSENQYRRLTENSPAVVYQFKMTPEGEFSFPFINSTVKRVMNLAPDEIKEDAGLILDKIHPDDKENFRKCVLQSAQTLQPYHQIFRHENDGRIIWLEAYSSPDRIEDGSILWDGLLFDISKRMAAEEELKSKTDQIETFFSSTLDLLCIADTSGNFIKVNKAWEKALGYSVDDLQGHKFLDFVHPEDIEATLEAVSRLTNQEEVLSFTNRYRTVKGDYRHIEWKSSPRGSFIYAAARDITERLASEKAIKTSKQRLDLAMSAANSGLWDWDVEKNQVYFDERYFTMAGYEPDEFPHDFAEWEKRVHPQDLPECQQVISDYLSGKSESFTIEFRFLRKTGDWMWIKGHGKAAGRSSDGKILRMVGTHADITERRLAEERVKEFSERLQAIMNSIESCIYIADMQTHEVLFVNQYGKNAWGKDITGEICYKAIQNLDLPCPFCTNDKLLDEEGKPAEPYKWEFRNNFNGKWYQIVDRAISWTDGRIVRMEVATDITEIKQAQQLIASKNKELEQLIYVASHDLRSPLVNVDGYSRELEFALEDLENAVNNKNETEASESLANIQHEMQSALTHIRNSTRQMDNLLKGLLKLSRLGRAALNLSHLDMNELMPEIISTQGFSAKNIGAEIFVDELPPCNGDRLQVSQVFANLIGNAIKFLEPARPGQISITGKNENDRSIYCVEDNGIGISEQHKEKIFQLFHRLNPGKTEGEGLGLTIVKQILSMLDGEITVESIPDKGSRFYVSLPYSQQG